VINMTPVLQRGYTFWDRALLPTDEFEQRCREMQAAMKKAGLDAIVVWSAAYHPNGDLAYLAGWPMGGALMLLREGDPVIFSPGGGRELYFQKLQTWVTEISSTGGVLGAIIAKAMLERGVPAGGKVGMVGTEVLTSAGYAAANRELAGFQLVDFDEGYRAVTDRKRPREVLIVGRALKIAQAAVAAGEAAFAKGASTASAYVEAETVARLEKARDFRGLANIGGGDMRPYDGPNAARTEPLLLWAGVDHHGYWADAVNPSAGPPGSPAAKAVEAMIAAARPGATGGDVAKAGLAALPAAAHETALSYGLGAGIGLKLEEGPLIQPDSRYELVEGMLLSLRAFAVGDTPSLASAIVQVGATGAERIQPR
jgi:Xaa-Pro aminopeptidase